MQMVFVYYGGEFGEQANDFFWTGRYLHFERAYAEAWGRSSFTYRLGLGTKLNVNSFIDVTGVIIDCMLQTVVGSWSDVQRRRLHD